MQELKLKTRRVLEAVYDNGGEATTPEIKEQTGIEKSATLRYHAEDVLEERGLVECRMENTEAHPAGVRHVEITEEGRERIAQLFEGSEDIPISDRMNDIEDKFQETQSHVTELIGELREIENKVEDQHREAQKAREKAEETRDIFDVLRDDVTGRIERLEERLDTLGERVDRVAGQNDEILDMHGGLQMFLDDLDTRLTKIEDKEPDSAEEVAEVIEVSAVDAPAQEGEIDSKISKLIRYLDQLDPSEYGLRDRHDVMSHMHDTFSLTSEELNSAMRQSEITDELHG